MEPQKCFNRLALVVGGEQSDDSGQKVAPVIICGQIDDLPRQGDGIVASGETQASHFAKSHAMPMLAALRRRMPDDWRSIFAASRASSAKVPRGRRFRVP